MTSRAGLRAGNSELVSGGREKKKLSRHAVIAFCAKIKHLWRSKAINMIGSNGIRGVDYCAMEEDNIQFTLPQKRKNVTVAVEGNIGSGKTTLLKYFRKNDEVEVIEEPVSKWQNVGGSNLLELFYKDCQRWSFLFESYALLTLMQIHKRPHTTPIKMVERSVYSGYYCFEHNLCASGLMASVEHGVHNDWFTWITEKEQPQLDLIIYLRTTPEKCMERIKQRCRSEETSVSMDLLKELHDRHEAWLIEKKFPVPAPVVILMRCTSQIVDGNRSLDEMYRFYDSNTGCLLGMDTCVPCEGLEVRQ
ncbi:deoxynucleoside kinase isoform X2 [Nematostella vectensis]|uniref:deoxynucleoside kinase isoform X2 n=1 Tax=Nematostella vectensis TaxID=45351 RepID=UPI00207729DC|nr:deoxynucleoside kinase isoform X2 [Nematostella vectensis]